MTKYIVESYSVKLPNLIKQFILSSFFDFLKFLVDRKTISYLVSVTTDHSQRFISNILKIF